MSTIGIRREDKNSWERRAPLTPNAIATLATEGVQTQLQRSSNRVFADAAYESCGAFLVDDPFDADLVLAIKEIPAELLRKGGSYLFFSHTIKGQPCNMGLLKRLIKLGCNLLDYECITDEQGQRLVFFGHHAGMAGMLDTLWACGQRLKALNHAATPFADLLPAHRYDGLTEIKQAVATAGDIIRTEGLPTSLALPLVCGFTGYGNVSQGAQYIWDQLPSEEITPESTGRAHRSNRCAARSCVQGGVP
jgi:saccharopine dehydrogenase (NAD+, L-lysine-forming)